MIDPLVIIPGFMQDARAFMPQIVDLGADRQIILLPLKGGDSLAQISQHWLPLLPQSFTVLAHSLGGDLALDLLHRAPERITRMAMIGCDPLGAAAHADAASREARLRLARAGRLADALAEDVPATALADMPWRHEVMALLQDMGQRLGFDEYLRQTRLRQHRADPQDTLRRVKVPALILTGREDPLVPPRRADLLAGLMPFGQVTRIAHAGHMPQLEQPETVTTALRQFLAGPLLLR